MSQIERICYIFHISVVFMMLLVSLILSHWVVIYVSLSSAFRRWHQSEVLIHLCTPPEKNVWIHILSLETTERNCDVQIINMNGIGWQESLATVTRDF